MIPSVKFDKPEVYDVDDSSLTLRWNTVDVPAFSPCDEPLAFVIERQILPSYEWEPLASDVTDRSYTVSGLEPYQDYNFRVRGLYPSGYTEPSPHVPVYRRPSESQLGLGVDPRSVVRPLSSQRYASEPPVSRSLHSSIPNIYIRKPRPVEDFSLDRSYSNPDLHASMSLPESGRVYRPGCVPDPKFKLEQAYVYRKSRSPSKKPEVAQQYASEQFATYLESRAAEKKKPEKGYDLYEWYLRQRRNSDVGLDELKRNRSRSTEFIRDDRRIDLIQEARRARKSSLSTIPQRKLLEIQEGAKLVEGTNKTPSVADRYEDIKTPYVMDPGRWAFPRRHSIAADSTDLARIQRLQTDVLRAKNVEKTKQREKPQAKEFVPIPRTPEEYFKGVHFRVEDEVQFRNSRPQFKARPTHKPRSMSVDLEPGYFVVSKFSVAVTGVKPTPAYVPRETRSAVRVESRSVNRDYRRYTTTRSLTPDLSELRRRETRSYTPDIPDFSDIRSALTHRSLTLAADMERMKGRRQSFARYSRDRSVQPSSSSRSYVKPRSYSVSVPPTEGRFNRNVEDSKSLITKYSSLTERSTDQLNSSRSTSMARSTPTTVPSKYRSMSVSDLRSDRRYSTSGRSSSTRQDVMSDSRYTTQSRGSLSVNADVKRDSRYSSTPRGSSVSLRPPSQDLKSDPRYTSSPRLSVSTPEARFSSRKSSLALAAAQNEDLKSKLDTVAAQLAAKTPKPKKSRTVMKFKSSKGEGAVYES